MGGRSVVYDETERGLFSFLFLSCFVVVTVSGRFFCVVDVMLLFL